MKLDELLSKANDTITVRRVYGEPYEKDGLTVIPAAAVSGGGGGGSGHDEKGESGEGAGFGVAGRPVGAFVIKDGQVIWRPALDPNRLIAVIGLVVAAYFVSRPRLLRAKARAVREVRRARRRH